MTAKLSKTPFVVTAKNIHHVMDLHPEQVIHAFKVVLKDGKPAIHARGRYKGRIHYRLGKVTAQRRCNTDREQACGVGLHVATKAWCRNWWPNNLDRAGREIFIVRFKRKDVGVVPYNDYAWPHDKRYSGKFRVYRMLVWKRTDWRGGWSELK